MLLACYNDNNNPTRNMIRPVTFSEIRCFALVDFYIIHQSFLIIQSRVASMCRTRKDSENQLIERQASRENDI